MLCSHMCVMFVIEIEKLVHCRISSENDLLSRCIFRSRKKDDQLEAAEHSIIRVKRILCTTISLCSKTRKKLI